MGGAKRRVGILNSIEVTCEAINVEADEVHPEKKKVRECAGTVCPERNRQI